MSMDNWRELGRKIKALVNLDTFPVAVTLLQDEADIPESARRPLRDLKAGMAPCQGYAMTRRYGWTVAFGQDDVACAIAAHTYGWDRIEDEGGAIDFFTRMNYAHDEESARQMVRRLRCLEVSKRRAVVFSPLERTTIEPDVVVLYANPAQVMRLIHGATYHSGIPIEGGFSGRAASCTEGIVASYLDNAPKVVVPGNGDRVWATCQDHEMMVAVPASRVASLLEGLDKTHSRGIRYPIPTYVRYTPEIGMSMPLADIFKRRK